MFTIREISETFFLSESGIRCQTKEEAMRVTVEERLEDLFYNKGDLAHVIIKHRKDIINWLQQLDLLEPEK